MKDPTKYNEEMDCTRDDFYLKTYDVIVREVVITTYRVQASSKETAIQEVMFNPYVVGDQRVDAPTFHAKPVGKHTVS